MRPAELLREIVAATWTQRVPSTLVAVLVGAMCLATLLTVGRSAAAELQVAARMDAAGSRIVTIRDQGTERLVSSGAVAVVAGLDGVEAAFGLGVARDVTNGAAGGTQVPARVVVGDVTTAVRLVEGRWPGPGEALVSGGAQTALGLTGPFGYVVADGREHAVVGRFDPRPAAPELAGGVVVAEPAGPADALRILTSDAGSVHAVTSRAIEVLAPADLSRIQVESPASLAQVQQEVAGDLSRFSRVLLLGVLAAGATLVAVVVLSDVLVRRVDLGRRRALGATRSVIVALVTGRVVLPAIVGAAVGTALGLAQTAQMGARPPVDFAVATAVLALAAAVCAAVPPAVFAANRDPVAVLRTP